MAVMSVMMYFINRNINERPAMQPAHAPTPRPEPDLVAEMLTEI
jgi:hypothetical protein